MTWEFLHRWYMPFVWITLSSLIAVPLAIYFEQGMPMHHGSELGLAYGNDWVLRDDLLASLMPYLLNLGCVIWLFNADGSTRWAAFWALLVGIGRVAAPVALATMSDVTMATGQHYIDWNMLRIVLWFGDIQFFAMGIMLWMAFAHFVGQNNGLPAHAAAEAY
jgi:hypothetical protein